MREIEIYLIRGHQFSNANRVAGLMSEGFVSFSTEDRDDVPEGIEPVFIRQYNQRRSDTFVNNLEMQIREWKERQRPGFFDENDISMIIVQFQEPLRPVLEQIREVFKRELSGISDIQITEITVKGDPNTIYNDSDNYEGYNHYNERELYV